MARHGSQAFHERLARLEEKHNAIARGGVLQADLSGHTTVRKGKSRLPRIVVFFALLLGLTWTLKATMYAIEGPIDYQERITTLANGPAPDKAMSVVMAADPVTVWMADTGISLSLLSVEKAVEWHSYLTSEPWEDDNVMPQEKSRTQGDGAAF
ncbi:MAG: hypothetical protein AAF092_15845 [Pseudomonadota bacterium]